MNKSFINSIIGSEALDKNIVLNRVIFVNRLLWQRISVMLPCVQCKRYYGRKNMNKSVFFSENFCLKLYYAI